MHRAQSSGHRVKKRQKIKVKMNVGEQITLYMKVAIQSFPLFHPVMHKE